MATWDPAQYLSFADHRIRPALELLARVRQEAPAQVADLGCGPGNVTHTLRQRWPQAEIVGVDNSREMLAKARTVDTTIRWQEADLNDWAPEGPQDVIYANAALHWLPDHPALFVRLMEMLTPGGTLAVQMPRNFLEPSHAAVADAVRAGPWEATLTPVLRPVPVSDPQVYYDILAPVSGSVDIWETRYLQVFQGENPVADFTKGSWLKPFLDALEEPQRSDFEADYRARIQQAYPRRADGATLFPFQRLFIIATR